MAAHVRPGEVLPGFARVPFCVRRCREVPARTPMVPMVSPALLSCLQTGVEPRLSLVCSSPGSRATMTLIGSSDAGLESPHGGSHAARISVEPSQHRSEMSGFSSVEGSKNAASAAVQMDLTVRVVAGPSTSTHASSRSSQAGPSLGEPQRVAQSLLTEMVVRRRFFANSITAAV